MRTAVPGTGSRRPARLEPGVLEPGTLPSDAPGPDASPSPVRLAPGSADAIVVAAGSSTRMAGRDKLSADIGGRPLLGWTLAALDRVSVVGRIVLVVAPERRAEWAAAAWLPASVVAVVDGGGRRHESVAAGLEALVALDRARAPGDQAAAPGSNVRAGTAANRTVAESNAQIAASAAQIAGPEDRVILVHDGARPVIDLELVERVAAAAASSGAAVPVVAIVETVKRITDGRIGETIDRTGLAVTQTPQGVRRSLLRAAYRTFPAAGPEAWTDEAALLEACRIPVDAIPGDPANVKVTTPDDLDRVSLLLAGERSIRIGLGEDSHPFGPGSPLVLGGITVEGAPRLHGHSDGDVALHAVADALLGAAGLGDLGRIHPAGPATPAGIASGELLASVVGRLASVGLRPAQVDLTIEAARPRLADRLDGMARAIAAILGLRADRVNVKASTGNLIGSEGAGRGISARAVALVEPAGVTTR